MTAATCSRDGLTINGVGNVACGKDTWDVGAGVGVIHLDVALAINLHTGMLGAVGICAWQESIGIGMMSDG